MDIKDVSDVPLVGADPEWPNRGRTPEPTPTQTTRQKLDDEDAVGYPAGPALASPRDSADLRKLNEAIEATNLASDAVTKIGEMLSGIEGIAAESADPTVPQDKLKFLEQAARSLRDQIAKTATVKTSHGAKPLSGDSIRVELEETLGKTLEIILPSSAESAFGLDAVTLSPKDLILDTMAKVHAARQGIEELRNKLADGVGTIGTMVAALDKAPIVAASGSSKLRDVEQVWTTARQAHGEIKDHPDLALRVIGDIQRNAPRLLF
jgi:hypothetical protein